MMTLRALVVFVAVLVAACATSGDPSRPTTSEPTVRCLGVTNDVCREMLMVVRVRFAPEVDAASEVIIADTCPPDSMCDRQFQFDAAVVIVPADGGPPLFLSVTGQDRPDQVKPWVGPLPEHVEALLPNQ